jgi:hypothetical protein
MLTQQQGVKKVTGLLSKSTLNLNSPLTFNFINLENTYHQKKTHQNT